MDSINRINPYTRIGGYTGNVGRVKQINKDEKNRQQDSKKKKEYFKDTFEWSKKEEEK